MKTLTKAEEDIMQELWQLKKTSVNTIIDRLPKPKPAYNTVSTIVRILENKGFVGHEPQGRGYLYFPLIDKDEYSKFTTQKIADDYFAGSFKQMVSFFVNNEDIDLKDLEDIINRVNKQ